MDSWCLTNIHSHLCHRGDTETNHQVTSLQFAAHVTSCCKEPAWEQNKTKNKTKTNKKTKMNSNEQRKQTQILATDEDVNIFSCWIRYYSNNNFNNKTYSSACCSDDNTNNINNNTNNYKNKRSQFCQIPIYYIKWRAWSAIVFNTFCI